MILDSLIGFAIGDLLGIDSYNKTREELLENPIVHLHQNKYLYNEYLNEEMIKSIIIKKEINELDIANRFYNLFNSNLIDNKYIELDTKLSIYKTKENNKLNGLNNTSNNALIRMIPLSLYCHVKRYRQDKVYDLVKRVSSITNSSEDSFIACFILVNFIMNILNGKDKLASLSMVKCQDYSFFNQDKLSKFDRILNSDLTSLSINDIKTSNDVVESLEACLWVFLKSDKYRDAVVGAINLGGNTCLYGSIVSSISAMFYKRVNIPEKYIKEVPNLDELKYLSNKFEDVLKDN